MTRVEFISSWRVKLRKSLDVLAHNTLRNTLTPDAYQNARGQYRQILEMIREFDAEIKRIQGGDDDDGIAEAEPTPATDDDGFDTPVPQGAVRRRPQTKQARPWL
jgi:hypothetical protein